MARSKAQDMQRVLHYFREITGTSEVDMRDVAEFAIQKLGWKQPEPIDPVDRLARQFSKAAREETRIDQATGRPYRANHAIPTKDARGQLRFLWGDLDEMPRHRAHKSLQHRREQAVGDVTMLVYDADHWNGTHPGEEPLQIELDFTMDVELRKNASDSLDDVG